MKRKLMIIAVFLLVAAGIGFVIRFDGLPGPMPDSEEARLAINQALDSSGSETRHQSHAVQILDRLQLDKRHAVVPYISKSGAYSLSFWVWDKYKWRVGRIDTGGGPYIWKLSEKDPSRHYLVWNMNPKGYIRDFSFYMIRERSAGRDNGIDYYKPRIQMKLPVELDAHPYGAVPYPEHWAKLLEEEWLLQRNKEQGLLSLLNRTEVTTGIGWLPVLAEDEPPPLDYSTHGYTFLDNINIDFVWIMDDVPMEIEKPQ